MDGLTQWLASVGAWMEANEQAFDIGLVWVLVVGSYVAAAVEFITYEILLNNTSGSVFGRRLRLKKLAYAFFFVMLGTLYAGSLILYYAYPAQPIGLWFRMSLRTGLALALFSLILFGILWLISYVRVMRART